MTMQNFILTTLLLCLSSLGFSQTDSLQAISTPEAIPDSLSLELEPSTDSLVDALDQMRIPLVDESIYISLDQLRDSVMPRDELSMIPDSVFIARLAALDQNSPFHLDYNRHVRSALQGYCGKNNQLSARVLGLAELYFPMFEEALDREGLPLELKYLAVIESALQPTARSRAGATGLWQFMYGTAKENGLEISSYIDERKSPQASTDAACKYLKRLYNMYDDWNLALAAYNSGPGNVNKAIRRAGGKTDYWEIWEHLPRETRGYVPAFIAVNYVMNYNAEHGIHPIAPVIRYSECDTIMVDGPIKFAQIAEYTGVDLDLLRMLNPQYHKDYIPASNQSWVLVLPMKEAGLFVSHETEIREYVPVKVEPSAAVSTYTSASRKNYYSTEGLVKETYTVRSGDVIGVIADRHGVGLSKLRYWNNISGSRIYPGQKLVIYKNPNQPSASKRQAALASRKTYVPIDENARYHTIRPGDTLWDIAKLYDGVSVSQIKTWNSHLNFKRLKPGQKVRVSS